MCWTKNIHLWFSSSRQIYCVAERSGVAFEAKSLSSDGYLDTIFQDGIVCAIVSVATWSWKMTWGTNLGMISTRSAKNSPNEAIFNFHSEICFRHSSKVKNWFFWAFCGFWRVDVWLNLDIVCLSTDVCFIGKLIFLTSISRLLRISVRIAIWISPLNEL